MNSITLNNFDMKALANAVDSCSGSVYLVAGNGIRIDLRSSLPVAIALCSALKGSTMANAEFQFSDPDDEIQLIRTMAAC